MHHFLKCFYRNAWFNYPENMRSYVSLGSYRELGLLSVSIVSVPFPNHSTIKCQLRKTKLRQLGRFYPSSLSSKSISWYSNLVSASKITHKSEQSKFSVVDLSLSWFAICMEQRYFAWIGSTDTGVKAFCVVWDWGLGPLYCLWRRHSMDVSPFRAAWHGHGGCSDAR